MNLYAFVANSPSTRWDYLGMCFLWTFGCEEETAVDPELQAELDHEQFMQDTGQNDLTTWNFQRALRSMTTALSNGLNAILNTFGVGVPQGNVTIGELVVVESGQETSSNNIAGTVNSAIGIASSVVSESADDINLGRTAATIARGANIVGATSATFEIIEGVETDQGELIASGGANLLVLGGSVLLGGPPGVALLGSYLVGDPVAEDFVEAVVPDGYELFEEQLRHEESDFTIEDFYNHHPDAIPFD